MIIVMEPGATDGHVTGVVERVKAAGLTTHISVGVARTVIGVVGDDRTKEMLREALEGMPGVERVVAILQPFKLVSREFQPEDTIVRVRGQSIGSARVAVIAGPCSVESREQILSTAEAVKAAGAGFLRGGAFKPRTSPYSFQGMEEEGLQLLAEARARTGLPVVTEAMDAAQLELVARYADVVQIGARNMQNYPLLREAGRMKLPVLLKRGVSATIEEFLLAAEYILNEGNYQVVLCERGIRGFNSHTRYTLDLSAVPVLKRLSHLPVIVDPSHGTGKWRYVGSMARAAVAAGADGLMIEVHPDPANALSDGPQSLNLENFADLMGSLRPLAAAVGRVL
ncbi:MAG: 3-deoxy-7-phosphoheptulonate synthase [Armatimonadota bacterium]|nr:3-deoxy-7-phosphoheptulonate synthase [Armatimonadota bacterium]MDR7484744.1 3-deoxy-7-phosphoheptulonate synthase [Armatimonadota bacterium]MDR7531859.1 3-deoxy-7-phosphoheptulonate synthase [Armatimonadota bacterium]MDR7534796.1 3-deoxy-7-phosphoheptulonate synthase [Armatimonadota bacterium]